MNKGRPQERELYQLTGKSGEACIMNGNTWEESRVIQTKTNIVNVNKVLREYLVDCIGYSEQEIAELEDSELHECLGMHEEDFIHYLKTF